MLILPLDYIAGLIEGEGSFSFCSIPQWKCLNNGCEVRVKIPAFQIRMHERDEDLIRALRNTLGLDNIVYNYPPTKTKRFIKPYKSGRLAVLIVRDTAALRNIIPLFYKRLYGYKRKQFFEWLEKMGNPEMSNDSQYLYRLFKKGVFENLSQKFI